MYVKNDGLEVDVDGLKMRVSNLIKIEIDDQTIDFKIVDL